LDVFCKNNFGHTASYVLGDFWNILEAFPKTIFATLPDVYRAIFGKYLDVFAKPILVTLLLSLSHTHRLAIASPLNGAIMFSIHRNMKILQPSSRHEMKKTSCYFKLEIRVARFFSRYIIPKWEKYTIKAINIPNGQKLQLKHLMAVKCIGSPKFPIASLSQHCSCVNLPCMNRM
jgi:hypothetical protein